MQDAIYQCYDIAYPLHTDTFDRHSHLLMLWYHPACYHCICSLPSPTSTECSVCSVLRGLWSVQTWDHFPAFGFGFMNITLAEWVAKRSSDSKGILMDAKCWKGIVGQSVGPHHRSPMRSRWHYTLSVSLFSSERVYQLCPEYLTGTIESPWDLICTGVHLVEVVWDNLHIMLHLHPAFMTMAHLL